MSVVHIGSKHRLVLPITIYQKLRAYVQTVPFEISGLGSIEVVKSAGLVDFIVRDLYLVRQNSGVSDTVLDPVGIAELMMHRIQAKETLPLKLWWHSHGKLSVFWSQMDERTIMDLGRSWMISLVMNHEGAWLGRVDVYQPFHNSFDLPITVDIPRDSVLEEAVRKEVGEKVTYVEPETQEDEYGYPVYPARFLATD